MHAVIAQRLRVLGHPLRVAIMDALRDGELKLQDVADHVGTSEQNASRHALRLHQAGVLARRPSGREVFYSIARRRALELLDVAEHW